MMVRIMIVALLIGSAVLGYIAYENHKEIQRYEAALAPGGLVETTVEKTQNKAYQYTQYAARKSAEGVKGGGEESIALFVRKIARDDKVNWGNVLIGKAKQSSVTINKTRYLDTSYKVEPVEKGQAFDRPRIANYLYLLEDKSNKVKVTDITLEHVGKVAAHEVPEDLWDVKFDITVRTRDEKQKK